MTNSLYICGAHALPGAIKALQPGLVVSAAPELPPPPDCVPRHYVPLLDQPHADMLPFMELVADLIHEVSLFYLACLKITNLFTVINNLYCQMFNTYHCKLKCN